MADQLDTIPPDATILVVRAIPEYASRRSSRQIEFVPGDLFMWTDNYDPNDPDSVEVDCFAVALSAEAREQFVEESWSFDESLSVFVEDCDPVHPDLEDVLRTAVALIGEMPIDTNCLLSELSNAAAS